MLECVTFQQKISENLVKSERIYPQLIDKIKSIYTGLRKMLKEKEEEQIEQIK